MFKKSCISKGLYLSLLTVLLTFFVGALSGVNNQATTELILADFDGGVINKSDFEEELATIPEMYRSRFATLEGQTDFLKSITLSRVFLLEAKASGIDKKDETIEALNNALKPYYIEEYRRREISQNIKISKSDITGYYNDNLDRFKEPADAVITLLMTDDEQKSKDAYKALTEEKVDFLDVLNQYSTNDYANRYKGVIKNIRGTGYIPGVGIDDELNDAIWAAPMNKWIGPLATKTGFHIFKVSVKAEARQKLLAEVEEDVKQRLLPIKEREASDKRVEELKKKYNITIDEELLKSLNLAEFPIDEELAEKIVVNSNVEAFQKTAQDLAMVFQRYSQQEKAKLADPENRVERINQLLKDDLFYREAMDKDYFGDGVNKVDTPLAKEVDTIKRNVISQKVFEALVVNPSKPTQEQIENYYNENIDKFKTKNHRSIQYFVYGTKKEASKYHSKLGKLLKAKVVDENEISELIKTSLFKEHTGTIPQIFRDEDKIPGVGNEPELSKAIWNTEVGKISKIAKNAEGNFFFVRVTSDTPAKTYQLSELRNRIIQVITQKNQQDNWSKAQEDLFKKFNVTIHEDRLSTLLTAKELFNLAEDAQKRKRYTEAIKFYDQIIENHKNNDDDYKALFMKAFLIAEEMGNKEEAIALFKTILNDFPEADLHESAEFMIKSLEDENYDIFEEIDGKK